MNIIERVIKRTFDFWLALISLIFFSPVIAIIAILIRREEPDGDVIFQQERLTKIGAFIRAHHLDEFPQLWNVLKGEMAFVGPRPERKFFIDQIMEHNPDYARLYALRPGLFSYATLYNGYTDTMEKMLERLRLDLEYLDNYSLWFDVKIIFLTAFSIIFGKKF